MRLYFFCINENQEINFCCFISFISRIFNSRFFYCMAEHWWCTKCWDRADTYTSAVERGVCKPKEHLMSIEKRANTISLKKSFQFMQEFSSLMSLLLELNASFNVSTISECLNALVLVHNVDDFVVVVVGSSSNKLIYMFDMCCFNLFITIDTGSHSHTLNISHLNWTFKSLTHVYSFYRIRNQFYIMNYSQSFFKKFFNASRSFILQAVWSNLLQQKFNKCLQYSRMNSWIIINELVQCVN